MKRWSLLALLLVLLSVNLPLNAGQGMLPAVPLEPVPLESVPFVPAPPQGVRRLIVITMDGLRADAPAAAGTPNLMALADGGAAAWDAKTVMPAVTLVAHTSILTGLGTDEHGLVHNDNLYPCPPIPYPTFVTQAQQAGYRTAQVVGKEKFCIFNQTPDVDYTFATMLDLSVADRVIELLDADYQVIFAHFPGVDYAGHTAGWMSEMYLEYVRYADWHLARVLTALDQRGMREETLIIITADHGGHDFRHGDDTPEDRTVPFIIAGPGVVPGTVMDDVFVTDVAPTALWALGITPAYIGQGEPRYDAFGLPMPEGS